LLKQKIEIIYVDMKIDRAIEAPNFWMLKLKERWTLCAFMDSK
jgi:hypothetical protein